MPPAKGGGNTRDSSPSIPPAPQRSGRQYNAPGGGGGRGRNRPRSRRRGYDLPGDEKPRFRTSQITILLSVFNSTSQGWRTRPVTVSRRISDQDLWIEIRRIYRDQLQKPWRRLLLFKKLKHLLPIEYTRNDVPIRMDPKDYPDSHEFMHCYNHPHRLSSHSTRWIEWFDDFENDPNKSYGLEFVESLWTEKLALLAIAFTVAIIVVSIVWCVKGGNLQTVFTVMGFVLSFAAAEVALIALYYQITLPG